MVKFYNPKIIEIKKLPIIVYFDEGIEQLLNREDPAALNKHFDKLYSDNLDSALNQIDMNGFNIDILWENKKGLMTDVWIYSQLNKWGSGALVDEKTFRGYKLDTSVGVSSEHELIMLGKEAEHRVGKKLNEYLQKRPVLPQFLVNGKDFLK